MEMLKDDKGNMTTAALLTASEFDALLRLASRKQAEKAQRAIRRWELQRSLLRSILNLKKK